MYERVKRLRLIILILAVLSVLFFWGLRQCESTKLETPVVQAFESKEDLGRALFFDERLSGDNSISCASCHHPELAFTDGKPKSIGVGGKEAFRNAPTLLNVVEATAFMFDAHIASLEEQAIVPIQDSTEMNIRMGDLIKKLRAIPEYSEAAKRIYGREFDAWVLTRSLAAFERTLISKNSPFDQYMKSGNKEDLGEDAWRGWQLFQEYKCVECHAPPNFTDYSARNNGWKEDYGNDLGKFRINGDSSLLGAFKVPSLRNIVLTAPYMHDGSASTLDEVLNHYSAGGIKHPNQDFRIRPMNFSEQDRKFLISFLQSLTDTSYMVNYR